MVQRSPLVTLAAVAVGLVALLIVDSAHSVSPGASPPPAQSSPAPTATGPSSASPPSTSRPSASPSTTPSTTPLPKAAAVYAGRTGGGFATLAIAVAGGRGAAYLCDGHRIESWLTGTVHDSVLTLHSKTGDRLLGTRHGTTISGSVTVHGRQVLFTVPRAEAPAGLYRARAQTRAAIATIGWIVLSDGTQVGVENDGTPHPAPRLDTRSSTSILNGNPVSAVRVTGAEVF